MDNGSIGLNHGVQRTGPPHAYDTSRWPGGYERMTQILVAAVGLRIFTSCASRVEVWPPSRQTDRSTPKYVPRFALDNPAT
jgi:hypothetical protein